MVSTLEGAAPRGAEDAAPRLPIPLVDLQAQYLPLEDEVLGTIRDILRGMHLFLGPQQQAFEAAFAAYCGATACATVGNGTDALVLALRACGIGAGAEVITVAHTFIATAEAIALVGARPVYVDVDPATYTMDPAQVEARITPRTRALIPVHLYGQIADMAPLQAIADRHGLRVIEDACQAHGATYRGQRAGSIGDAAAFSFYFSKNLGAYGEGGAITTRDAAIDAQVRLLRNHGQAQRYYHAVIGTNARMDEIQAAVLAIKLRHLDAWNAARRAHAATYARRAGGHAAGAARGGGGAGARVSPVRGARAGARPATALADRPSGGHRDPLPGADPPAGGHGGRRPAGAAGDRGAGGRDPVTADVCGTHGRADRVRRGLRPRLLRAGLSARRRHTHAGVKPTPAFCLPRGRLLVRPQFAQDARGVAGDDGAWGDVAGDDAARADDGARADGDAAEDRGARAD